MNKGGKKTLKGFSSIRISSLFIAVLFYSLFFESLLQDLLPALSYLDEAVVLAFLSVYLINFKKHDRGQLRVIAALGVYLLIGAIGSWITQAQALVPSLIDMFTCSKFCFIYLAASSLLKEPEEAIDLIVSVSKPLILLMFFGAILNLFIDIGLNTTHSIRYGLRAYTFILPHPTYLVQSLVGLTGLLLLHREKNLFWIAITLFVIGASLRSKGFAFIGVTLVVLLIAKRGKIKGFDILVIGVLALFIGYSSIETYFFDPDEARGVMFRTSISVANDLFPFGSGFGSFGSNVSKVDYSPLYFWYGIASVWGISPQFPAFIADSFWPALIAQFGWIGTGVFIVLIGLIAADINKRCGENKNALFGAALVFLYILISSPGELSFYTPFSAVYLFLTIALIVNYKEAR